MLELFNLFCMCLIIFPLFILFEWLTQIPFSNFLLNCISRVLGAPLVAQTVQNLPAVGETWVQSLGQEDPLEMEMATYSSILAWEIPWTE